MICYLVFVVSSCFFLLDPLRGFSNKPSKLLFGRVGSGGGGGRFVLSEADDFDLFLDTGDKGALPSPCAKLWRRGDAVEPDVGERGGELDGTAKL